MSKSQWSGLLVAGMLAACGAPPEETGFENSENTWEAHRRAHDHGFDRHHDSPLDRGSYLVGSRTIFVRDVDRSFDPWNEIYGSKEYQALIDQLNEIGEPRTLVTEVWYPVERPRDCRKDFLPRDRRCAIPGSRLATYLDYSLGDRDIFDRRGVSPYLVTATGETVGELEATMPKEHALLVAGVLDELAARERGSWLNAPAARGHFPLIVMSHGGFTGNVRPDSHREVFTSEAETLASHGYIVVAMNHTGDSRLPTVFHDEGSVLRQRGPKAVDDAYEILFSQAPVPDRITSLIFQPGGWPRANTMMQRLFEMRVDDVVSVIDAMRDLDAERSGFLSGRIDLDDVAVSGFSLGSMTAQIALSSVMGKGIETGMSWNNGLPNAWEPPRFRGLDKPHFFSLSFEDDLSRTFFTNVPFLIYPNVVPGGQPSDFLFLEGERFFPPTRDNPEPVVRTAYDRADGPKLLLGLVDATHWDVTDYDDYLFPRHRLAAGETLVAFDNVLRHLPFGNDVLDPRFVGELYETMSWEQTRSGEWVYRPHRIRNYYSIAWYGLYLNHAESFRHFLRHDPFRDTVVRSEGVDHRHWRR